MDSKEVNIPSTNGEESTIKEIQEDFQLKFEINKWEQRMNKSTGKGEVVFEMEVTSEITKKKWSVYHSIKDFVELISNLSSSCLNVPACPELKLLEKEKERGSSLINKAIKIFFDFIKKISFRPDIINTKYFIEFFKLENNNHIENDFKYDPKVAFEIKDLKYPISDMIFLEKNQLLFIGCSLDNDEKLLTKINKFKFWKKNSINGEILIYKLSLNKINPEEINNSNKNKNTYFTQINKVETESGISCLYMAESTNYLFVGYCNGYVEVFELSEDISALTSQPIKSLMKIQVSKNLNKVLNIGYNPVMKYIYTTCFKENEISVFAMDNSKFPIFTLPVSEDNLCGFCYLYKYNNYLTDLIIGLDIKGRLSIGSIDNQNKKLNLYFVLLDQLNYAATFKINWEKNHIYIGDYYGNVHILNFIFPEEKIEENSDIKKLFKIQKIFSNSLFNEAPTILNNKMTNLILGNYPYKIKDINYNTNKNEIFISLSNGTVQIFSHFKNFAECTLYENKKGIEKTIFQKYKSILITGGGDNCVFGYYIPGNYRSEMCRRLQDANDFNVLSDSKICRNAIEKGYPTSTESFKKISLIDRLPDVK